jgi:CBS domain containing-hemolysin-like protein
MTAILAVASIALLGSFICSLLEAVLYTVSSAQIEVLKSQGKHGVDRLARMRSKIDAPIAAILTINTITHTVGSSVCGAMVASHYGEFWVGVFAGVFTLAILLLTEIFPKSLGVKYARQLAPYVAWPIQIMIWMVYPIVQICRWLMGTVGRGGHDHDSTPSEHEIIASSRLAAQRGVLRPQEVRWLENALRLDEVRAEDLMTPRTVVYRLPADLPLSQVQHRSQHWIHSRLPVTEDRDPDHILGMVYRREVFDSIVLGERAKTLRDLMHTIDFIPASMRGHQLLDRFITQKKHMCAVVDEYGAFVGVVTLEDVLECLLGSEIVDEHDRHVDMQQVARERAQRYEEILQPAVEPPPPASLPAGD